MAAPKGMHRLPDRHEADPRRLAKLEARFWAKVRKSDDLFSCWEWTAGKSWCGYGRFYVPGVGTLQAHRAAHWLTTGRDPGGLFCCHRCDNPGCVRPDHLFLGTQADNLRDAARKGRCSTQRQPEIVRAGVAAAAAAKRAKTSCAHGHELTSGNTCTTASGERRCRTCHRLHDRKSKAGKLVANREAINAYKRGRYAANREAERLRARERYVADPEAKRLRERTRYAANREAELAKHRARYATNREAEKAQARERYAANAEVMRLRAREYKARRRAAAVSETVG